MQKIFITNEVKKKKNLKPSKIEIRKKELEIMDEKKNKELGRKRYKED